MSAKSHYPEYNVMKEKDDWDAHTRQIVESRLVRERGYSSVSDLEAEVLRALCVELCDDERGDVIQYAVCHIDDTLSKNIGEGQRKPQVPPQDALVRSGISALQEMSMHRFQKPFFGLDRQQRRILLEEISGGKADPPSCWNGVPQKEWFNKLLKLTLEAVYSHPDVWSEIGYGGPAYPRGYIRTGIGQLDPWEAKRVDNRT